MIWIYWCKLGGPMINTLANPNIILARFFCSGKGKGGRAPAALAARVVPAAPMLQGAKKSSIFNSLFLLGGRWGSDKGSGPQRPQLGPFPGQKIERSTRSG